MGASKSRRSRGVALDRGRYGASRPSLHRPTLPIVVVVCDDMVAACSYFADLKREVKSLITVDIRSAPCHGAMPADVLSRGAECAKELTSADSHDPEDAKECVWVLIDLEAEPKRRRAAFDAQRAADAAGVSVALSEPCFEVWTLAHLIDTGMGFNGCADVVNRLASEWERVLGQPFPKKSSADYSKLRTLRASAIARSKRRSAGTDQSWTEVYKVVELILMKAGKIPARDATPSA